MLAVAGGGPTRLLEIATGRETASFESGEGMSASVAFAADGARLLTASDMAPPRVWSLAERKLLRELVPGGEDEEAGFAFPGAAAGFSADGAVAVTAISGGGLRVWDVAGGGVRRKIEVGRDAARAVALSADGRRLAIAGERRIEIWDTVSGERRAVCEGHTDRIVALAFRSDGKRLASGSHDCTARVWDAETGAAVRTMAPAARGWPYVLSVAWSPDGTRLALGGNMHDVRVFGPDGEDEIWSAVGGFRVDALAFTPDGARLVVGGSGGHVEIRNAADGAASPRPRVPPDAVYRVAFAPDGRTLLTAGQGTRLWDAATGAFVRDFDAPPFGAEAACFSPDGTLVATADQNTHFVHLMKATSGAVVHRFEHEGPVMDVAISPDGAQVATAGYDKGAHLWSVETGERVRTLAHPGPVGGVAWSPDGARLATVAEDGNIRLWDVAAGQSVTQAQDPIEKPDVVAFSPDGRLIAAGGWAAEVGLWEAATGRRIRTLAPTPGEGGGRRRRRGEGEEPFLGLAFSPDGRWLVAGGGEGRAFAWTVADGCLALTLHAHRGIVGAVAFRRDGARLATGGWDGQVLVWDLAALRAAGPVVADPWAAAAPVPAKLPPVEVPAAAPEDARRVDGCYLTPIEVVEFHDERLRLGDGTFRYWFRSDAVVEGGPTDPLEGRYSVAGDVVTLHHPEIHQGGRTFMLVNGVPVLWRQDGLRVWREHRRIHPYGVMIRVEGDDPMRARPRSVEVLEDDELRAALEKEYQERHNDAPEPIRTLLRARSERDDPNLDKLRAALDKARRDLDPRLFAELVYLLDQRESHFHVEGRMLLEGLIARPFWQETDPFGGDDAWRQRALERLADAIAGARTPLGLESCVEAFLRAVGGGAAEIEIPGGRSKLHVSWKRTENGETSSSTAGTWLSGEPESDASAKETMKRAISAVQAWCRAELDRRFPKPAGR